MKTSIATLVLAMLGGAGLATAQPTVSVGDASTLEGEAGETRQLTFVVSLSRASDRQVAVQFNTASCNATAGSDFTAVSGQVDFPPGVRTRAIEVSVHGDDEDEGTETLELVLSAPVNAVAGDVLAEGSILSDDDPASPRKAPGDLDGDGRSDLWVWYDLEDGRPEGREIVWGVNGPIASPPPPTALIDRGERQLAGTADFDGDSRPDLLWLLPDGSIDFSYATGSGFAPPSDGTAPAAGTGGHRIVGTGDLDADGHPDVLTWDAAAGELVAWMMDLARIDRLLPTDPPGPPQPNWTPVATGDFNGDGATDVLWEQAEPRQFFVWLLDGLRRVDTIALQPAAPASAGWLFGAAGDFNGDGHSDVVWRNTTSTKLVVWFLRDGGRTCGTFLVPERLDHPNLPGWRWTLTGPR